MTVYADARLDRSRARAWVLQIHYRWESAGRGATLGDALRETLTTRRVGPSRLPYIHRLVAALDEHGVDIDRQVQGALENWRLERLAAIDRGILRLATAELLFLDDVPPQGLDSGSDLPGGAIWRTRVIPVRERRARCLVPGTS